MGGTRPPGPVSVNRVEIVVRVGNGIEVRGGYLIFRKGWI